MVGGPLSSEGRVATLANDVTSVIVADIEPRDRSALEIALDSHGNITVVGQADDGRAVASLVQRLCPDVALVHVRMPGCDAVEIARSLANGPCDTRLVLLSSFDVDDQVIRGLAYGAVGFTRSDVPPSALVEVVQQAASDDRVGSQADFLTTVDMLRANHSLPTPVLNFVDVVPDDDRKLFALLGRGYSNGEIARQLGVRTACVARRIATARAASGSTRLQLAACVQRTSWN